MLFAAIAAIVAWILSVTFGDFLQWLRSGRVMASVFKLAGGTALGQGLVVVTMPLLTRLYSPEDMGAFSLFMAFIGFAGVAVSLRYDMAIMSASSDQEADDLLRLSTYLLPFTSAIATLALLLLIRFDALSFSRLPSWSLGAAFLLLGATGFFTAFRFWVIRSGRVGIVGRASVGQGAARAIVPLILSLISPGWFGLMMGELMARLVGLGGFLGHARRVGLSWRLNLGRLWEIARRYVSYPKMVLPSSAIDALGAALPVPIIATLFGIRAAGEYALIYRLAAIPASLVSGSVADVLHARMVTAMNSDQSSLRPLLGLAVRKLLLLALLVYLPVSLVAPLAAGFLFGPLWAESGVVFSALAPLFIAAFIVSPLSRMLLVVKRQERKLVFDLAFLILPLLALTLSASIGFVTSLWAFSLTGALTYLVYFVVIYRATPTGVESGKL